MSLRFPYRLSSTGRFIPSLSGRTARPRPAVVITVVGPNGSRPMTATVDTGADDTVFPESIASTIGVDLSTAPILPGQGVGMVTMPLRYAQVTLRLTDGRERCEWPAWVAFAPLRMRRALLGFSGCLQFFTATFLGDVEEVDLDPNQLYPGTHAKT